MFNVTPANGGEFWNGVAILLKRVTPICGAILTCRWPHRPRKLLVRRIPSGPNGGVLAMNEVVKNTFIS
jgi:hypothetical protein